MRLCTADVLVDLGYDVIEAASGEQALRLLDEGPAPDVLVTDYLMPGMSGADLAQAVRARKPGLPILSCLATPILTGSLQTCRG